MQPLGGFVSIGLFLAALDCQFSLLSPLELPRWKSGELLPEKTAVPLVREDLPYHRQAGEIDRRLVGVDQGYPAPLKNSIVRVPSLWMVKQPSPEQRKRIAIRSIKINILSIFVFIVEGVVFVDGQTCGGSCDQLAEVSPPDCQGCQLNRRRNDGTS